MNTNFESPFPRIGNVLHLGKWKRSALKKTPQLMLTIDVVVVPPLCQAMACPKFDWDLCVHRLFGL